MTMPSINRWLSVLSKDWGGQADVAGNGIEAIRSLKEFPYDLVFMDVQMPEMDGYEATQLIRKPATGVRNSEVPVVAMTAHAMQGDKDKCLSARMNDYVSKPIKREALAEVLHKWLPQITDSLIAAKQTVSSTQEDFPDIPGVDVQKAFRFLGVDANEYTRLLLDLSDDAQAALQTLPELEQDDVPVDIATLAHKLAGAAANLRAVRIEEAARTLEQAAKRGEMSASMVQDFKEALQAYIESVKSLEVVEEAEETGEFDLQASNRLLDEMEELIASSDIVEDELVIDLERSLACRVDKVVLNKLKSSPQSFDYQDAEEAVRKIRGQLDSEEHK